MKKSLVLAFCLFVVGALVLTGCGKSAAEKAAEKTIEESTNGTADVDIGDNSVTVNTNAGSWSAGDEVDLPEGFPSDVYVIEGTIKAATSSAENETYTVSVETDKSVSEAKAEYDTELADEGWTNTLSMTLSGVVALGAEKDDRTASINISTDEETGKTLVVIGTSRNGE